MPGTQAQEALLRASRGRGRDREGRRVGRGGTGFGLAAAWGASCVGSASVLGWLRPPQFPAAAGTGMRGGCGAFRALAQCLSIRRATPQSPAVSSERREPGPIFSVSPATLAGKPCRLQAAIADGSRPGLRVSRELHSSGPARACLALKVGEALFQHRMERVPALAAPGTSERFLWSAPPLQGEPEVEPPPGSPACGARRVATPPTAPAHASEPGEPSAHRVVQLGLESTASTASRTGHTESRSAASATPTGTTRGAARAPRA